MDVVVERCAGIDVHKDTVVTCVRTPGADGQREVVTKTFGVTIQLVDRCPSL
jgi:transposase